jgi:hypothetical protein
MPRALLFLVTALFGLLTSTAHAEPADERYCGHSADGKVRWCVTIRAPWECGGTTGEGWHCDADSCWCGPANALEDPGPDSSRLPLIAREAARHGVTCVVVTHEDTSSPPTLVGDCGYAGWVCREGWCQDSEERGWFSAEEQAQV